MIGLESHVEPESVDMSLLAGCLLEMLSIDMTAVPIGYSAPIR
jgi:hypothetical protein